MPRTAREQQTKQMTHTGGSGSGASLLSSSILNVGDVATLLCPFPSCLCNSCSSPDAPYVQQSSKTLRFGHHLLLYRSLFAVLYHLSYYCQQLQMGAGLQCGAAASSRTLPPKALSTLHEHQWHAALLGVARHFSRLSLLSSSAQTPDHSANTNRTCLPQNVCTEIQGTLFAYKFTHASYH